MGAKYKFHSFIPLFSLLVMVVMATSSLARHEKAGPVVQGAKPATSPFEARYATGLIVDRLAPPSPKQLDADAQAHFGDLSLEDMGPSPAISPSTEWWLIYNTKLVEINTSNKKCYCWSSSCTTYYVLPALYMDEIKE